MTAKNDEETQEPKSPTPPSIVERLTELVAYLPAGAHEPKSGYTGVLSYSVEWHALMIGLSAGITAATTGDTQRVMGIVTAALGLGRGQQELSDTVTSQIVAEPWYVLAGAGIGYYGVMLTENNELLRGLFTGSGTA